MSIPLAGLRAIAERYLPDSAAITRNAPTYSGDGATDSWSTVATVSCRVSPLASGTNASIGGSGGVDEVAQWTVWLPALTDVRVTDRLVVGSRTFEINRVGARSYETARECICREIS